MDVQLPTIDDVVAASIRIAGHAVVTPLLRSAELDRLTGGTVLIKPEVLQRTGSFKFRGAFNRLSQLSPDQRRAGAVAWSSGNHAQAVAAAGEILGVRTTIVMPADAPAIKVANTRGYGAEVVLYDRVRESREEIGMRIAAERGAVIVPPYDDPHIIAGQGTAGLEIAREANALGLTVDASITPTSGGGLTAGVVLALKHAFPDIRAFTAEPENYDDHRRSIASGSLQRNASVAKALCDGLLAPTPGELTWSLNRPQLSGGYVLTNEDVQEAMKFAFRSLKLVVEPSGAIALAALLTGGHDTRGKVTAVVLSGGNTDPATFAACISA
ncbi:MAG: threonine/serine dehydratase [Rhodospirillaceae bacterium]